MPLVPEFKPQRAERETPEGFARLWQGFMTGRVLIAITLLALQLGLAINNSQYGSRELWILAICVAYTVQTVLTRLLARPTMAGHEFTRQWFGTALTDIGLYALLHITRSGALTFLPLFVYPVLMSGVLATRRLALGTAALCTLVLLTTPWLEQPGSMAQITSETLQGALASIGLLLVALLTSQLASRLQIAQAEALRTEADAQRSRAEAQVMRLINERVIQAMPQGVLVVDEGLQVRSANPAALVMLGLSEQHPIAALGLRDQPGWAELVDAALVTLARGAIEQLELRVTQRSRAQVHLNVTTQTTAALATPSQRPMCIFFMQDLRESEAKIRTEKLASMGRMSAAVAHEIRNPLAAITQANALLQEELQDPGLRQLSDMVAKNAQRLGRIVDDILDVARVAPGREVIHEALALDLQVRTITQEWATQHHAQERLRLTLSAPDELVQFRLDHLRRILINLLDNALRYASTRPGAIQVTTHAAPAGPVLLMVWSDGQALDPGVQKHLFEPFFSSESRSSGLGLYICQELCHRNGGSIGYERTPRVVDGESLMGNEFVVEAKRWQPSP